MANTKRTRATIVKNEAVSQASNLLSNLPEKTRDELTVREAIGQLQEPIRMALTKGYDHTEIAQLLTENGVKISASTLKSYAPQAKRKTTRGRKPRSINGNGKSTLDESPFPVEVEPVSSDSASPTDASVESVEAEVQPVKPRRGRRKASSPPEATSTLSIEEDSSLVKPRRGRGRPAKAQSDTPTARKPRQAAKEMAKPKTTRRRKVASAD